MRWPGRALALFGAVLLCVGAGLLEWGTEVGGLVVVHVIIFCAELEAAHPGPAFRTTLFAIGCSAVIANHVAHCC